MNAPWTVGGPSIEALADAGLVRCTRCHEVEQDALTKETPDGNTLCRYCASVPAVCRECGEWRELYELAEGRCCMGPDDVEADSARSLGLAP